MTSSFGCEYGGAFDSDFERASEELFNDDVCAALEIMMKHGVSLLRSDMKRKPIHNIHT